jgi:hypothetical protein
LEALSDYASSRYAPPRPIKIVMASCGDPNAAWVSSANTETLCYELADDFFDLYDGYTTNGKVQDQGLVSKDVARISLAHNALAGTLDKVAMEICRASRLSLRLTSVLKPIASIWRRVFSSVTICCAPDCLPLAAALSFSRCM